MLYSKKGDSGKTTLYACNQSISKSSAITEALGALDEANSYLGVCKATLKNYDLANLKIIGRKITDVTDDLQNDLFTVQAQIAGANKDIKTERVKTIEKIVSEIEQVLPPIKTFIVPGSCINSANFDFARTLVRRAERRVVAVAEEGKVKVTKNSLTYINRLSSVLYALARYLSLQSLTKECSPKY